jgi:hypothetical protein
MSSLWQQLREQWFRILLVGLSLGLLAGALIVVFKPPLVSAKLTPLPVRANEYEIAWLYPATNTTTWERFIAAMRSANERLKEQHENVTFEIGDAAYPLQMTDVPEVAIRWKDQDKRLVFRWYKLSSSSKTRDWVEALAQRSPPPLAVIGGGNSYSGLELARQMQRVCQKLPEAIRPLLLLSTATADYVPVTNSSDAEAPEILVNQLYPERTFRYCFSNRQMAFATTRFLWEHDDVVYGEQQQVGGWFPMSRLLMKHEELRPEAEPVIEVAWQDDSYSTDLLLGYQFARRSLEARALAREWAWLASCGQTGTFPLLGGCLPGEHLGWQPSIQPQGFGIFSSVGTYHAPNQFENEAVHELLKDLDKLPRQRRMLIVTGQFQPTRRFLHALARSALDAPERLVVVTGDTISFNHIYRDRLAAWRTQDLPFPLVFFCHRNPIDPAAGFDPAAGRVTGTEDVLLFRDVVESVVTAFGQAGGAADAPELARMLRTIGLHDGRFRIDPESRLLFTHDGMRNSGTGEHVVYLRPNREGNLVLADAWVEVWTRDAAPGVRTQWRLVGSLSVPDPQIELDRGTQP